MSSHTIRKIGAGYAKFERMHWGVMLKAVGTRDELIGSGLASDYMFAGIGKICRTGCDEYGDAFRIYRRSGGRFALARSFSDDPCTPYGWKNKQPFDVMPRVLEIRDSGLSAN